MRYETVENYTRQRIIEKLPMFSEENCVIADIDSLVEHLGETDERFGCVLDYAGWVRDRNAPFAKSTGTWYIDALFIIVMRDDTQSIDKDLRELVGDIREKLGRPERIDGVTPAVFVDKIEGAAPGLMNDLPIYLFGVSFKVHD